MADVAGDRTPASIMSRRIIIPLWLSAIGGHSVDIAAAATAKRPKDMSSRNPRGDQIHDHIATPAARRKHVDLFGGVRHRHNYQPVQNLSCSQGRQSRCRVSDVGLMEHGRLARVS
jgi:hypothetical protein